MTIDKKNSNFILLSPAQEKKKQNQSQFDYLLSFSIDFVFATKNISIRICKVGKKTKEDNQQRHRVAKNTVIVIDAVVVQNLLVSFSCVLGRDTLRHFFLLNILDKQF